MTDPILPRSPSLEDLYAAARRHCVAVTGGRSWADEVLTTTRLRPASRHATHDEDAYYDPDERLIVLRQYASRELRRLVDHLADPAAEPLTPGDLRHVKTALTILLHEFLHGIGPEREAAWRRNWTTARGGSAIHCLDEGACQLGALAEVDPFIRASGLGRRVPGLLAAHPLRVYYPAETSAMAAALDAVAEVTGRTWREELHLLLADGCGTRGLGRLVGRILRARGLDRLPTPARTRTAVEIRRAITGPLTEVHRRTPPAGDVAEIARLGAGLGADVAVRLREALDAGDRRLARAGLSPWEAPRPWRRSVPGDGLGVAS